MLKLNNSMFKQALQNWPITELVVTERYNKNSQLDTSARDDVDKFRTFAENWR